MEIDLTFFQGHFPLHRIFDAHGFQLVAFFLQEGFDAGFKKIGRSCGHPAVFQDFGRAGRGFRRFLGVTAAAGQETSGDGGQGQDRQ